MKMKLLASCITFAFGGIVHAASMFDNGIPAGWTGVGQYGISAAQGSVTASPVAGGKSHGWVSTFDGMQGVGLASAIGGAVPVVGSQLRSDVFNAQAGEELRFYFNYVTSDGTRGDMSAPGDYAWARLLDDAGNEVAILFTARSAEKNPVVPGEDMPGMSAVLSPVSGAVDGSSPSWLPLGWDSAEYNHGGCAKGVNCGVTGWMESTYIIPSSGSYILEFGVTDTDGGYAASALAFDGVEVGGQPIGGGGLTQTTLITTGAGIQNGEAWIWGFRNSAQQGNGQRASADNAPPARVEVLKDTVTSLTGGAYHLIALTNNGDVYGWGQSGYGETGCEPPRNSIYVADPCVVLKNGVQVAAGEYFSIALDGDGTVWTWGHDLYGQLGNGVRGTRYNTNVPQKVDLQGETARLIGAAYEGAFAVTKEGHVWAWGDNEASGLGFQGSIYGVQRIEPTPTHVTNLDQYADRITYIAGGNGWGEALLDDGTVIGWGLRAAIGQGTTMTNISSPYPVVVTTGVKKLFARYVGSFALTENGQLFTWGQTGGSAFPMIYGAAPTLRMPAGKVTDIGGGKEHLFYKTEDGKVYGVGYNDLYKLDLSTCCGIIRNWPGIEINLKP